MLQGASGGAADALFVKVVGRQTEWKIVDALRRLGVPTAAIVDADIFADDGVEWTRMLDAAGVADAERDTLRAHRDRAVPRATKEDRRGDLKKRGREALSGEEQGAFDQTLRILERHGVFIVPVGELECWLRELGNFSKQRWLEGTLSAMGNDPSEEGYVRPSDDDVWAFIRQVAAWLESHRVGRRRTPD